MFTWLHGTPETWQTVCVLTWSLASNLSRTHSRKIFRENFAKFWKKIRNCHGDINVSHKWDTAKEEVFLLGSDQFFALVTLAVSRPHGWDIDTALRSCRPHEEYDPSITIWNFIESDRHIYWCKYFFYTEWAPVSGYEHRAWIDGKRTPRGQIWEWSSGVLVTHNLVDNMGTESHLALSADNYTIHDLPDMEGIGVLCESSEWCTLQ